MNQMTPVKPIMRWYTTITAGLLPPRIRAQYGLPWGRADEFVFRRSLAAIQPTYSRLPDRLRCVPAYFEAVNRLEGRPRPDRVGRTFEKVLLQMVRPREAA